MKIAFTTKGTQWDSKMDPRFGRTEFFLIYDDEKDELLNFDNRDIANEAHGAGPKTAQTFISLKANVLITGNGPGGNAATVLKRSGAEIWTGAGNMSVKEAYDAYKSGKLNKM
jgi:predicted Fe-Mo cluster-binding NifX family protein